MDHQMMLVISFHCIFHEIPYEMKATCIKSSHLNMTQVRSSL